MILPPPQQDPVCSVSQCTSTVAPSGPAPVRPANQCSQDIQVGKAVSANSPPGNVVDIQSRAPIQPIAQKSFDKGRITSKTNTPGWCPHVGANDNLVIRFSDDDSGSDSEGCIKEKATETKSNMTGVVGNRKPPPPSQSKLNKKTTTSAVSKTMPKRLSLNRTFISAIAKTPGPNFISAGASSAEQGNRVRKFNSLSKNLQSRECGYDQGMNLNVSKLQDLRQQIALRESELKLKSAQRSKESASFRDDNALTVHSDATRKLGATSAKSSQIEPKEPDKKRAKVSGSYSTQLNAVVPKEAGGGKSILLLKEPAMQNNNVLDTIKFDHGHKGVSLGRIESSIVKWKKQNEKQKAGLSENTLVGMNNGAKVITNCTQSDGSSRQRDPDPAVMLNCSTSPTNNNVELNPSKASCHKEPSSILNRETRGKDIARASHPNILPNDKTFETTSDNIYQAPFSNESLWTCLSNANVSGGSNMNIQSLVEMEESLDKDLEEAQEHRRICEIEERNVFKAYRKAQRALAEANTRCTNLYRKRELYSAHLRSFTLDNSSLLCPSRQNEKGGIELDYSNDASENMFLIQSSHQLQSGYDVLSPRGVGSNFQYLNNVPVQTSYRHVHGQNVGSEPCSEPDASTSETLSHKGKATADGVRSPLNDQNISADEDDEMVSLEQDTIQPSGECHGKNPKFDDDEKDVNKVRSRNLTIDSSHGYFIEATLRSELLARLGTNGLSKNCENYASKEKTHTSLLSFPSSIADKSEQSDRGGPVRREIRDSEVPMEIQQGCYIENAHSFDNFEDNRFFNKEGSCVLISEISAPNIFRSAFGHLKISFPLTLTQWLARNQQKYTSGTRHNEEGCVGPEKVQWNNTKPDSTYETKPDSTCETVAELYARGNGPYTCDIAIDPFRPLCMYELRGKCNNDECPWQHVRDNLNRTVSHDKRGDSDNNAKNPKCHDVMISPTYLIGLDTLKADLHSYKSVLAWRNDRCWQKCFSLSLTLSNLSQKDLPGYGPLLHGSDGRIEVEGSWSRTSSYFMSRSGIVNQLTQSLADYEQALEIAVIIFNQAVDKLEGMKKALAVISRALEDDPASVFLWILYLLIYHSTVDSVGKDDMFFYAVKYNAGSYELWLMYINSRMHLHDRLATYDAALSALCHNASASEWDGVHTSACILDLFLQMIDCLCMSGNVEKAIQKIFEFSAADKNSHERLLLLSDIHSCLKISDKCIFWVCSVYLVIYRKLPEAVVRQFECEKLLLEIEWPSILLPDDEKQMAVKLMEKGAVSVASLMKIESLRSDDTNVKSAQLFAVSHIRCMAALGSLEYCGNLLDRYLGLYPFCLELVLISTRAHKQEFRDLSVGFEEILINWPKEVPGIQCVWNQYAQCALQNGGREFGKELLDRWFHSVWKVHYHQNGVLPGVDSENKDGLPESASDSILEISPGLDKIDEMFGFLNLSLYKLWQNDHVAARIAAEKALKTAIPKYFKYCFREHATLCLTGESVLKEPASISGMENILEHYIGVLQDFPVPEPLPRKFINNIKKPRVQQLINNMFSPVSSDFFLVNLVLEVWFGPSLLPEEFTEPKHLVDFVEGMLDICPSNYVLAMSVCKLFRKRDESTHFTSVSMCFWASSNLVNTILHAIPIPPECVWVEAATILGKVKGVEVLSQRFYGRALLAYPFSVKLWKSYQLLYGNTEKTKAIAEAAKAKGIDLD
ncbi:uncharacterized protein LOC21409015 isoform X4 [Morus notabilis]|uniref:uncharacterized protein LOC21409015 isoform X4 n=1 Tax=Morus notabilis TaxID=981085 RepID=UPI000CECE3DE|nr:uncharacterized protein LOC21409015 isoform X4 [Morus notabilis]